MKTTKNLNFEDCVEIKKLQYPVQIKGIISGVNYITKYWLPNERINAFCLRNGKEYVSLKLAEIALGVNIDNIIVIK